LAICMLFESQKFSAMLNPQHLIRLVLEMESQLNAERDLAQV